MKVVILGAGAWGTTMAIHLARQGHDVWLWSRDADRAATMQKDRENERYLPSFRFPDSITVAADLPPHEVDFIAGAVPTQHMRGVVTALAGRLPRVPFVSLAKGIEIGTGKLPTEVYQEAVGAPVDTAVLTGPCIAKEVARGMPTAVVIAGERAEMLQLAFNDDRFRVYTSEDRVGAELAAALKNVLGIAAGIVDGMELGDNTKAALLTRGIVELTRLGVALGANALTFTGLAGFGDLFTTCVSPLGRNRGVGERIGQGDTVEEILESMTSVAEGVPTTRAVVALAKDKGVEMPIADALFKVLFEDVEVAVALGGLMTRDKRPEYA
ncbi:MAG: NAD(P)-dependent glycerol-3-phosphate dehydrogenase [Planctomycetota bacterium]|nr:NAD(P)-dependent glycerol-3-phosphate dehydrogenase [Planctomycetota bacterium]